MFPEPPLLSSLLQYVTGHKTPAYERWRKAYEKAIRQQVEEEANERRRKRDHAISFDADATPPYRPSEAGQKFLVGELNRRSYSDQRGSEQGKIDELTEIALRGFCVAPGDSEGERELLYYLPRIEQAIRGRNNSSLSSAAAAVDVCAAILVRKIRKAGSADRDALRHLYVNIVKKYLSSNRDDWKIFVKCCSEDILKRRERGLLDIDSIVWFCVPFLDALVREGAINYATALDAVSQIDHALIGGKPDAATVAAAREAEGGRFAEWGRFFERMRSNPPTVREMSKTAAIGLFTIILTPLLLSVIILAFFGVFIGLFWVSEYFFPLENISYYDEGGGRNREAIGRALLIIGIPAVLLTYFLSPSEKKWGVAMWKRRPRKI